MHTVLRMRLARQLATLSLALCAFPLQARDDALSAHEQLALDIFREVIEIDTSPPHGTTAAAQAIARRLRAAGLSDDDLHLIESGPNKGNLVARLRSPWRGKPPVLLLAHLDVVAASPWDWSLPPFKFTEKDGFYYGRGTTDDKDEVAIHTANFLRWLKEGYKPNRDIILALTADEEGGDHNGVRYLLENHRDLVDAAFVINEGGGGLARNGERLANSVQAAEKIYQSYTLSVFNRGGHSSLPRADNAIYQLAAALQRIEAHQFPVQLNEVTRAMLRAGKDFMPPEQARFVDGVLNNPPDPEAVAAFSAQPAFNARLRTTCVATQLKAGHAENALPQRAEATVNCRILPGQKPAEVQAELTAIIGDTAVKLSPIKEAFASPPSPLTEDVMAPIMSLTEEFWPGTTVMPTMSSGATDGLFFRRAGIPVYGVSGLFGDMDDVRAHGRDERIEAHAFFQGLAFLDRLVRAYSSR